MRIFIILYICLLSINHLVSAQTCIDTTFNSSNATYYQPGIMGYCSYPVPASPIYIAALPPALYNFSASCGACLEIIGLTGSIIVSVEEQCSGCPANYIDLSQDVMPLIDTISQGISPIQWRYVACPVSGNVFAEFISGTNPYYLILLVTNHRFAISKVEFKSNGTPYAEMQRDASNQFILSPAVTPVTSPVSLRITDILGNVIEKDSIPFAIDSLLDMGNQFPECVVTLINEKHNSDLVIFPNPAESNVYIDASRFQGKIKQIDVLDLTGKSITSTQSIQENIITVNLSEYENGIYIIMAKTDSGIITKRISLLR
jgi:expansin